MAVAHPQKKTSSLLQFGTLNCTGGDSFRPGIKAQCFFFCIVTRRSRWKRSSPNAMYTYIFCFVGYWAQSFLCYVTVPLPATVKSAIESRSVFRPKKRSLKALWMGGTRAPRPSKTCVRFCRSVVCQSPRKARRDMLSKIASHYHLTTWNFV